MKNLKLPKEGFITGTVETDFGWVSLALSPKGLKECRFMYASKEEAESALSKYSDACGAAKESKIVEAWVEVMKDYFKGELRRLDNIPLDSDSWTDFQKKVYNAVMSIPYGKTASYGSIASFLGNGKASRAVGHALKMNPVPPIVPCHRVIAADKDMCGFSATGGVALKIKLLDLEKDNALSI